MVFLSCVILLASLIQVIISSPCDPEWKFSSLTRMCYRFYPVEVGWPSAEFGCYFKQAHLLSIHSSEDLQNAMGMARGAKSIWIGAAQFGRARQYTYSDHTPFDFENWPMGNRPPYNAGRKCIKLDVKTGEWSKSCCKVPSSYICVKNPNPKPDTNRVSQTNGQRWGSKSGGASSTDEFRV
ncbi:hypothetical protein AB6A40_000608 [Gnathostoma spinigerum]|uniref:C-type lectin domain-containing protein n=1 Tax=Gnathostoma spinigerum TaxID=75299 RepID=A0ABD6E6W6_9BILA